jgi:hypothetical protein
MAVFIASVQVLWSNIPSNSQDITKGIVIYRTKRDFVSLVVAIFHRQFK